MAPKTASQTPAGIRSLLSRIGLDDKEIEVYMALLPLKTARASLIAKRAKQSRSHTYLVLRSLEEKGLVSEVDRAGVLQFVAEPPQRLFQYVENREQQLTELKPLISGILPVLDSLQSPLAGQPRVTLLHGLDGMKQVYRDVLHEEFCAFFNAEVMYETFGEDIVKKIVGTYADLRAHDLLVDNASAKKYIREHRDDEQYEARILPKDITFGTDILIFRDTIALFAYDDDRTIVRIENQNIADCLRALHRGLWEVSRIV